MVSNPSCNPNSINFAQAFYEHGSLQRFATTIVNRPKRIWQRALCALGSVFRMELTAQFGKRSVDQLPPDLVLDYPWMELLRLGTSRIDRTGVMTDRIWEIAERRFDNWVSKHALEGASAITGTEHASRDTFVVAKKSGFFCIYDLWAPHPDYSDAIIDRETEKYPELKTSYFKHTHQSRVVERRAKRRREEWGMADLVIANSRLTANSYQENAGANVEAGSKKVVTVSLGAPVPIDSAGTGGTRGLGPVRFLFAGNFSIRKGCHYLAQAWEALNLSSDTATLTICGGFSLPQSVIGPISGRVQMLGSINKEALGEQYRRADVLLMPSLCDGFGMVVTEALANGLPVVTTNRVGAADLIQDKVNGLIVEAGDVDALKGAIEWCMANRAQLREMREAAIETARKNQWSNYRERLVSAVTQAYDQWKSTRPDAN